MRRQRTRWPTATFLAILVTAAACSGRVGEGFSGEERSAIDSDTNFSAAETTTTAASSETTAAAPTGVPADEQSAGGLGTGGVTPVLAQPTDLGRDIIFSAQLWVAVTDVAAAGAEASRIIQGLGGFLFGQQTSGDPEPSSVLVFKVFPEDFQTALDRLGKIGELRTQNVTADDVTERIVDLQSRINTAEASVERLRALLAEAASIEIVAQLENQLLERETALETLRGQLRTLEDQVALATIVLTLTEATTAPALRLDVTAYPGHDGAGLSCPGNPGLTVDEGGELTLCFEITNVGDTLLTGLELRDPILDVELGDLLVVFGDPAATLEPGQSVLLAYETVAARDIRTQTTVKARPVAEDGSPLPGREPSVTQSIFIDAVDPGGIPGFGEGLRASWQLLVDFGRLLVLVAGGLLPFAWVPLGLWAVVRLRRRSGRPVPTPPATPESEPKEPVGTASGS